MMPQWLLPTRAAEQRDLGKRRRVEIDGVSYPSVRAAAKALNVHRRVVYRKLGEGWRIR